MLTNNLENQKVVYEQFNAILKDWIPTGASIAIAVEDTFVYFFSGHVDISLQIGSKVPKDSMAYKILTEKKKIDAVMDSSLFNTPYYAIGYPFSFQGKTAAIIIVLPPLYKIDTIEPYRFLTGKQEEDWIPVAIEEIAYIESLQKRTWFYRNQEQFKTSVTLKELQTRLPDIFMRIHRSYIVNIRFIQKISKDITSNYVVYLKDGTELPISQSYLATVRTVLEF